MRVRRALLVGTAAVLVFAGAVSASNYTAAPLVQVSGASPFASCTADNVGGQSGQVFIGTEVEPWIDVNPTNPNNLAGIWQQDRWSNGAARGLVAGVTFNGGTSWTQVVIPKISVCSGGNAANGGDFLRATDPWLSFAPNGELYAMSLSTDLDAPPNGPGGFGKSAMLVSKSTDGGLTWGNPITLIRDENPRFLNDKNSLTADPTDSHFVYAVWDRLVLNTGSVIPPSFENAVGFGFDSPVYFSRTTDGGQTWEPAENIYDPGRNNQTIGNQIVVLPNGTLINGFMEFLNARNDDGGAQGDQSFSLIRSIDKGATWTHGRPVRAANIENVPVRDPDTGHPVRSGDFLPDLAVDRANGNLYAVWQDGRFSGGQVNGIAFTMSTNGGLTWSPVIKVNQTPINIPIGNQNAFVASVHVANGVVGVSYYDFRNNTSATNNLQTDYWLVHCHANCSNAASWSVAGSETRVTPTSFNMQLAAPTERGFFLGDYEGLTAVGNSFKPFFAQAGPGNPDSNIFFGSVGP
jgi:hypothetical protein